MKPRPMVANQNAAIDVANQAVKKASADARKPTIYKGENQTKIERG